MLGILSFYKKILKKWKNEKTLNLWNKKHDQMMYAYSDMECDRYSFLSFWAIFALTLLTTPKSKIKKKKTPQDFIILYLCTTNYNHMMYGSWDTKCDTDRQNFLIILGYFLPVYPPPPFPLNNQENQAFDKMIKLLEKLLSFYTWVP